MRRHVGSATYPQRMTRDIVEQWTSLACMAPTCRAAVGQCPVARWACRGAYPQLAVDDLCMTFESLRNHRFKVIHIIHRALWMTCGFVDLIYTAMCVSNLLRKVEK